VLEKLSEQGIPIDLTTSLADQKTTEFCLVRKDSELHTLFACLIYGILHSVYIFSC
jgi:hypothetical protein